MNRELEIRNWGAPARNSSAVPIARRTPHRRVRRENNMCRHIIQNGNHAIAAWRGGWYMDPNTKGVEKAQIRLPNREAIFEIWMVLKKKYVNSAFKKICNPMKTRIAVGGVKIENTRYLKG
jgi:hypothetical protein